MQKKLEHAARLKKKKVNLIKNMQDEAIKAHARGAYRKAINQFTKILTVTKESVKIHLLRAHCALKLSDFGIVRYDCSCVLAQEPTNEKAMLLIAKASYRITNDLNTAIQNLRYCVQILSVASINEKYEKNIHVVKEKKRKPGFLCQKELDKLMPLQRMMIHLEMLEIDQDWKTAANISDRAILLDAKGPLVGLLHAKSCRYYNLSYMNEETILSCTQALNFQLRLPKDSKDKMESLLNTFLTRAWAFYRIEKWDMAIADIKRAINYTMKDARIGYLRDLIEKSRKKKDYYDILEINRNATTKDIKKSFYKLALLYHPDKNQDPESKIRFIEIQEAYGVLMDPELRAKYDAGYKVDGSKATQRKESKFRFHPTGEKDERGHYKYWFFNKNGKKEWTTFKTTPKNYEKEKEDERKQQQESMNKNINKEFSRHCCLPTKSSKFNKKHN